MKVHERKEMTSVSGEELPLIEIFKRQPNLPIQKPFSDNVHNILLTPIRAELTSNVLSNYLLQLNNQRGFNHEKLGLLLLVNDHAGDIKNHSILSQNSLIVKYSTYLNEGIPGLTQIERLNIPQVYKDVAKEIIQKNILEIRFDYTHSRINGPHFGYIREHLFNLAIALKSTDLPDVRIHISDADTFYDPTYFHKVTTRNNKKMNFSRQDFLPAPEVHEGDKDIDISKDILIDFDTFRLWHYAHGLMRIIQGIFPTTTPTISADLSVFLDNGMLDPNLSAKLRESLYDEDWAIGAYLRKKIISTNDSVSTFTTHASLIGEVYNPLRARTSKAPLTPRSEAELLYNIISRHRYIGNGYALKDYSFLSNTSECIRQFELVIAKTHTTESDSTGHIEQFTTTNTYQTMLNTEIQKEDSKVASRLHILKKYIESLQDSNIPLSLIEKQQISPYLTYFPNEITRITNLLKEGWTSEQLANMYQQRCGQLFDSSASIHRHIAQLRCLYSYALTHDISLLKSYQEGRIRKDTYDQYCALIQLQ